jgi:hypothetical protein
MIRVATPWAFDPLFGVARAARYVLDSSADHLAETGNLLVHAI